MKDFIINELSEIDFESLLNELDTNISSSIETKLVFIGIGKTAYVAQRLTSSYISMNVDCRYLHAADAIHGDMGNIDKDYVCIFLSYSGETSEILNLAECLKKRGCKLMSVTNKAGSSLQSICDFSVFVNCSNGLPEYEKIPSISLYAFEILFDLYLIQICKSNNKSLLDFSYNHPGGGIGSWFNTSLKEVTKDILNISIEFDENIDIISKKMDELKTGIAFITLNDKFIGCLTSGDIRRINAKHASHLSINDLNKNPISISDNLSVQNALELMKEKDLNVLFIANQKKNIIGYVSIGDLVK